MCSRRADPDAAPSYSEHYFLLNFSIDAKIQSPLNKIIIIKYSMAPPTIHNKFMIKEAAVSSIINE